MLHGTARSWGTSGSTRTGMASVDAPKARHTEFIRGPEALTPANQVPIDSGG